MIMDRFSSIVICLLFSFLLFVSPTFSSDCEYVVVKHVIDGDTFESGKKSKVRLLGIDSPETNDPRRDVQWFGKEATEALEVLIEDREVCLRRDMDQTIDIDDYGRLLRYVWIHDRFINAELVRNGYALVYSFKPFQYHDEFEKYEKDARNNQKGLWNRETRKAWIEKRDREIQFSMTCGEEGTICPERAKDYIGKKVTVRFYVKKTKNTGKTIFLNSENNYKDSSNFTVVIFRKDALQFLEDPSEKYLNKAIDVTGEISLYRRRSQIIATSPSQIEIADKGNIRHNLTGTQ